MLRDFDLQQLEGIMLQRRQEYIDQLEIIIRILLSPAPDLEALKEQNKKKRNTFARYRRARRAFLAAVAEEERLALAA